MISNTKTSNIALFLSLCCILHCFLNVVTRQLHVIKVNVCFLHLEYAIIPPKPSLFLKMYVPKLSWNAKLSSNILDFYKLLIR